MRLHDGPKPVPILAHPECRDAAMQLFGLMGEVAAAQDRLGLARRCLDAVCRIAGARSGTLYLLDAAGRMLVPFSTVPDLSVSSQDALPLYLEDRANMRDPRTWCAFTGQTTVVADARGMHGFDRAAIAARDMRRRSVTRALLASPLRGNDDKTIGVLELSEIVGADGETPDVAYLDSLVPPLRAFAYQAAISLSNMALAERNRELVGEIDRRNAELETENGRLRQQAISVASRSEGLITRSPAMEAVLDLVAKVADSAVTVLILGETGTGKDVVARLVHAASPRHRGPFMPQNCAALPPDLLESELFGHRKGAFTGATSDKKGLFEAAHGGTLFLDEIGDMPLPLQTKLLRVLQDGEVRAVGALESRRFNVRIVAATNVDLRSRVAEGRFREDLFYRIAVFPVVLPVLRERAGDVLLLARHFLSEIGPAHGKGVPDLTAAAAAALDAYAFPGNVRELRNLIERALILSPAGQPIDVGSLPAELAPDRVRPALADGQPLRRDVRRYETDTIVKALEAAGGNRTHAAAALGISRRTLQEKIARYQLGREP